MENKTIYFYNTDKAYGCFSNFYPSPFELDGYSWKTAEHYFQAMKFEGTEHYHIIREVDKPMNAAKMGRQRTRPLRPDWEKVKVQVMYKALEAKFTSNNELRKVLLSTGDAKLVEHTKNDSYWADGGDDTGKNKLGLLLMELRSSYKDYDGLFYLPQWIAFPDKHPMDMFWRMGEGEDYIYKLFMWCEKWGELAVKEYERYFVVPDNLREFYQEKSNQ